MLRMLMNTAVSASTLMVATTKDTSMKAEVQCARDTPVEAMGKSPAVRMDVDTIDTIAILMTTLPATVQDQDQDPDQALAHADGS
jgi:hypothetical protein